MRGEKGQVLLLIVLLSATLLAIAGGIFFESLVQTQVTKIQEESIRALKAAEGLAEQALQQGSGTVVLDSNKLNLPGASGKAEVVSSLSNVFTTPLLAKDEQYTFYFYDYASGNIGPALTPTMKIAPEVDICDSNSFVVELTFVDLSNESFSRDVVGCPDKSIATKTFGTPFTAPASHVVILRVLSESSNFPGTKLVLTRLDVDPATGDYLVWPAQGKTVVSTVRTASGVKKTIRVFQSYPQIPASFFVTKFN